MTPLAITGMGIVGPLGTGRQTFQGALARWDDGGDPAFARQPTIAGLTHLPAGVLAEAWDFEASQYLGPKGLRNFDRLTKFLIVSAKLALEDAGLKRGGQHVLAPERIGVCSATAYGSLDDITELNRVAELEDPRFLNPSRFPNTVINSASGYVSIWEDLRAPNVTVVDGNCGALDAVLSSETHLRAGRADAFVIGGGEILSEALYLAFKKLALLAEHPEACKPGREDSRGMRVGEGAAYLCVERTADARAREIPVLGEIVGYGNAFEPPQSEAAIVQPSTRAMQRAITMALSDAALEPGAVDVVCSGASGIARFDLAEIAGIRAVLGDDAPIATPKALFGETFGASGVFGMAMALAWFGGVPVRPLLSGSVPARPSVALVTTTGYYGNASAVVVRGKEDNR